MRVFLNIIILNILLVVKIKKVYYVWEVALSYMY